MRIHSSSALIHACRKHPNEFSMKDFISNRCVKIHTYSTFSMRGLTDRIRYPRFESHLERLGGIGDGNSFTMPSQNEIYDYVMKAKCDAENDLVALGKRKTFFSVITEKFIVNCYYIFLVGVTIVRDAWQSFDQTGDDG